MLINGKTKTVSSLRPELLRSLNGGSVKAELRLEHVEHMFFIAGKAKDMGRISHLMRSLLEANLSPSVHTMNAFIGALVDADNFKAAQDTLKRFDARAFQPNDRTKELARRVYVAGANSSKAPLEDGEAGLSRTFSSIFNSSAQR